LIEPELSHLRHRVVLRESIPKPEAAKRLLRLVIQPDHEAVAAPKLNVVAINQLLCPYGSIGIAIG